MMRRDGEFVNIQRNGEPVSYGIVVEGRTEEGGIFYLVRHAPYKTLLYHESEVFDFMPDPNARERFE